MRIEEAKAWLRGERSNANLIRGNPEVSMGEQEASLAMADAASVLQAYWVVKAHEDLDLKPFERPKCVVCGEEQTDLIYVRTYRETIADLNLHIGFPVCDNHTLEDLKPDQYVMNNLIVEVH